MNIKTEFELDEAKKQQAEIDKAIEAYESRDLFSLYYTNERSWGLWLFKGSKTLVHERIANADGAGKLGPSGSERFDQFVGGSRRATEITATDAAYIQNPPEGEGWELRIREDGDEWFTFTRNIVLYGEAILDPGRLSGLRFCRKPQEKKEVSAMEELQEELIYLVANIGPILGAAKEALANCEKAINEG